jgi:hypothetical protein
MEQRLLVSASAKKQGGVQICESSAIKYLGSLMLRAKETSKSADYRPMPPAALALRRCCRRCDAWTERRAVSVASLRAPSCSAVYSHLDIDTARKMLQHKPPAEGAWKWWIDMQSRSLRHER